MEFQGNVGFRGESGTIYQEKRVGFRVKEHHPIYDRGGSRPAPTQKALVQPEELVRSQVELKLVLHGDVGLIGEQVSPLQLGKIKLENSLVGNWGSDYVPTTCVHRDWCDKKPI